MYFLLKMGIFHCYVCLPEGRWDGWFWANFPRWFLFEDLDAKKQSQFLDGFQNALRISSERLRRFVPWSSSQPDSQVYFIHSGRTWWGGASCSLVEYHPQQVIKSLVEQGFFGGWNPTQQKKGDYFIRQYKDPVINQPLTSIMECHWWVLITAHMCGRQSDGSV